MPGYKSVLCLLSLFTFSAAAQEFRATLTGRVIDQQGAAIPNARITAVLVDTGAKSQTMSGPDGLYTIPFLPPGLPGGNPGYCDQSLPNGVIMAVVL